MSNIKWEYDPIKLKDGSKSTHVLYGDNCFTISTNPNRWKSDNILKTDKVTLLYAGDYTKKLFNRFMFLDCSYSNAAENWWGSDIDFKTL
jgi:hypothetical protein